MRNQIMGLDIESADYERGEKIIVYISFRLNEIFLYSSFWDIM